MDPLKKWTWNSIEHPAVMNVLSGECTALNWCDQLETAASDPITGKVLCACAAMGIARGVMRDSKFNSQQATDALVLLQQWIDDPIDERFDRICSLLFGVDAPVLDQFGVTGWSLRVATSSVGNYEAGWALSGTCEAALKAGYIPVDLCRFAELEIRSREDKSM